ncbi:hypothetical protein [Halobacterium sp. R2-5]|uniref:hypothetical protein n=1 Tax=Halobacterium sp. R2-5 TaxID=2715751 RepID=UPI001AAE2B25|nr:hypothetical protein [Halobacterium sp. R2-5]
MKTRTLACDFDDARLLVKGALEFVEGVETYYEEAEGVVVAKTGFRFGVLTSSYGETITVQLRAVDDETTEVTVVAEKNVGLDVGANPEKFVLAFLDRLDALADSPMEDAVAVVDDRTRDGTKEVADPSQQADGTTVLAVVLAAIFAFFLLTILAI